MKTRSRRLKDTNLEASWELKRHVSQEGFLKFENFAKRSENMHDDKLKECAFSNGYK